MALRTVTPLLFCLPFVGFGQFVDDFADSNLNHDPVWVGTLDRFTVSNGRLSTNGPAESDTAWLSSEFQPDGSDTLSWEWSLALDFDPSNNNTVRFYLAASDSSLAETDGYYVRLGENGSGDVLRLYHEHSSVTTTVLSGSAIYANDPSLKVRIMRYPSGICMLKKRS